MLHGQDGVGGLLAGRVELRRRELHVIGLPLEGREAQVHLGGAVLVDPTALVIDALESEAVEHLDLVAVLDVDAAVGTALAATEGLERQEELEVQREVLEGLLGSRARGEELALIQVAAVPGVGVGAVEQDDRADRRLGTLGRAMTDDALEHEAFAVGGLTRKGAVLELGLDRTGEAHALAAALAFDLGLGGAIPTSTG